MIDWLIVHGQLALVQRVEGNRGPTQERAAEILVHLEQMFEEAGIHRPRGGWRVLTDLEDSGKVT
jgi:hypothetical protein